MYRVQFIGGHWTEIYIRCLPLRKEKKKRIIGRSACVLIYPVLEWNSTFLLVWPSVFIMLFVSKSVNMLITWSVFHLFNDDRWCCYLIFGCLVEKISVIMHFLLREPYFNSVALLGLFLSSQTEKSPICVELWMCFEMMNCILK